MSYQLMQALFPETLRLENKESRSARYFTWMELILLELRNELFIATR